MRGLSCPTFFLALTATFGCLRDHPQPLTRAVVEDALRPPTNEALNDRIRTLPHQLLHASRVNIEHELTPNEVALIAVVLNPTLQGERVKPILADAKVLQATILPNPSLNFSLDQPIGSNSSGEVTGYGLGLDWEFTSLITRDAKVKAAEAAADQIRLDLLWKEWQVAEAAKSAAFDVLALHRQHIVTQQLLAELSTIAEHAKKALEKHDETATDASAAEAAAADARVSLAETDRDLQDAKFLLNAAIGLPPGRAIAVARQARPRDVPDVANLLNNIDSRRIDLVALRRGYDSEEAAVRTAILGQFPKLVIGISNTRDYGNFLTLGPTVAVDLPFFDRNQANIAMERATREQLKREFIARVFEARSDVTRAAGLVHALDQVITAKSQEVESLNTFVQRSDDALKLGDTDSNSFYAVAVSLNQKQIELIKAELDRDHALIALELAAGASLDWDEPHPSTERVEP